MYDHQTRYARNKLPKTTYGNVKIEGTGDRLVYHVHGTNLSHLGLHGHFVTARELLLLLRLPSDNG